MQDNQCDYLMQILHDDSTATSTDGEPAAEGKSENGTHGQDSSEWLTVHSCLKRIRRWRVPPHWSVRDWFDEIMAEVT